MRFNTPYLFRWLKTGSYIGEQISEHTPAPIKGLLGDAYDATKGVAQKTMDVSKSIQGPIEDAGYRLGGVIGDMFGKATGGSEHDYADILQIIKDQEETALLQREAERLRRLARIQARKREHIREMTTKALKSPFI